MHLHLNDIIPSMGWLRLYKRSYLKADLFSGITVAIVALPQSMAYAMIAGLPVEYGLYASIVPTIIGSLWGSSDHLITGPTTTASLVVFSALAGIALPGSSDYIKLAFLLAAMAGLIRIAMGLARLGVLLNFVSHSVLLGFTTGAAVLIAFKQLPNLLGISVNNGGRLPEYLFHILSQIYQVHPLTFFLGLLSICVIVFFRRWRPNWPGTLLAMVLAGFIVTIFHLEDRHVEVVGAVRGGLPPFHLPDLSIWGQAGKLAPGALAIAILGLMEAISISQSIADQTRQRLNVNRELIGQGFANVGASIFGGYPCSGSFTRSAVNFRSGAKTPLSGIISGLAVLAIVIVAGPMASKLPLSALSAVLIVVSYQLIQPKDILRTLKATRADAAVMVVTFLVTVLLNIEFSIYVGVMLSIGLHLANTSHPQIYSMIPDSGTDKMKGSSHGMICCQMDIVQIEGSIYFGSSTFVRKDLRSRMRHHPNLTNLLIRMHKVNTLDASGIHTFETILHDIRSRSGDFYFSGVNHRVFDVLNNSGLLSELGHGHSQTTTSDAIRTAMRDSFCPAICAACNEAVFRECPDLKQGNWEIFGAGVRPRLCRISGDDKTKKTHSG